MIKPGNNQMMALFWVSMTSRVTRWAPPSDVRQGQLIKFKFKFKFKKKKQQRKNATYI